LNLPKARRLKKKDTFELIVTKKQQQEQVVATGVGTMVDEDNNIVNINSKRLINVLMSEAFRPHLLKMSDPLTNTELTAGLVTGQKSCEEALAMYNSDNSLLGQDHYPDADFDLNANKFSKLPASFWKEIKKEHYKLGAVRFYVCYAFC
jgi:hypothetical protein